MASRNSTLLQRPANEALMEERVNVGRGDAEAHIRWCRTSNSGTILLICMFFAILAIVQLLNTAGEMSLMILPLKSSSLNHFLKTRDLHSYIDNITTLIEPYSHSCQYLEETSIVALVTSAPSRFERRQAIRESWAQKIPTYFFLGLVGSLEEQLVDNYVESKQYNDLVIFDYLDTYTNLTLKTALMIQWSLQNCHQVEFVFKTDDDVMVNPWTLRKVVEEHAADKLIGYRIAGSTPNRNPYNKWHIPRWLYPEKVIPEYLSGTGYLINTGFLKNIYDAAFHIPLINVEDVYFTFLVAKHTLNYQLTHDQRLSPFQPIFPIACTYWDYASIHSLEPKAITNVWSKIEELGKEYESGKTVCSFYSQYLSVFSSNALLYR